jgi:hypothetical protein
VLAEGMRHVGAHFAAELDINWSWTRFLLFSDTEGDAKLVVQRIAWAKLKDRSQIKLERLCSFLHEAVVRDIKVFRPSSGL